MKHTLLLAALALPAHAELLATFHTSRGNVTASLQFDKTPQTVANFITLAQSTRTRIDPATGAVIRKPLYAGEKFFRVVNDPFSGQYAQTGSGTGNQTGSPGYVVRDEFDPALRHDTYVLSMANAGQPHTNGSQIFLTGGIPIPEFDDTHTVFGKITATASQTVLDAIMSAGSNGTTINSVSFQRTSPAAVAFNEHAQKLPVCSAFPGRLEVAPGVECIYHTNAFMPAGSVFQGYRSPNLQTWARLGQIYQGSGSGGDVDRFILDGAENARAFYNVSLVTYPDALAPASFAGRTLDMGLFTSDVMRFVFNATGQTGVFTYTANPSADPFFELLSYTATPYRAELIIDTITYGRLKFDCVFDSENTTKVVGRNISYQSQGGSYVGWSNGTLELSKP